MNQVANNTYAGTIQDGSGTVALTKSGPATLTLTGSSSYSGETIIRAGTLVLGTGGSINHPGANMMVGNLSGDNGNLLISGGSVTNSSAYLGSNAGAVGTATITSGTWINSFILYIGVFGTGTLNINGGTVTDDYGYVSLNTGSVGTATVTSGTWNNSNGLTVGYFRTGTLNLAGSGVVTIASGTGTLTLAQDAGATGTLNIGTGGPAGTLNAGDVTSGSGLATVNFYHTGNLTFAPHLTGTRSVNKLGPGTTTLTGSNSYTGATTIFAGTLEVTGGSAIGDASAVNLPGVILAGARLLVSSSETIGSLSGGAGANGEVALLSNTLTVGDASTATFGGTISGTAGTGTLVKKGTGVQNLNAGSVLTFDNLTANDGTINVNSALGTGAGTAVVAVNDTAGGASTKLRFGTVSQTLSSLSIGAGATVVFTSGTATGSFGGDGGLSFGDAGATAAVVPEPGALAAWVEGGRRPRAEVRPQLVAWIGAHPGARVLGKGFFTASKNSPACHLSVTQRSVML